MERVMSVASSAAVRAASAGPDRLLKQAAVLARVGDVSRSTLYHWRLRGEFPKPDRTISARPYWRESTVDAWIATSKADPESVGTGGDHENG
jgi:predicted DNA-binding transcriptional regulator AlpA